ncbi:MAG TPA: hypothetical protein G4O18_10750, partial [Dehalococcoidia bacterium]|nr:hypothetical protein [Dehalococcoidia bacterium]
MMPDYKVTLKRAFITGVKKGWGNFVWICKIVIPVSLLVALLQWSGWLYEADIILKPLMGWLNLPSEAALPILSGMLINLYATMAAIMRTSVIVTALMPERCWIIPSMMRLWAIRLKTAISVIWP